jgi:hypothetical protein
MTRKLVALLVVGLVFAPAASAKGPHVVLSSGPEAVEPGKPWVATLELNEFPRPPHPLVVASQGERRVNGRVRPASASMDGAAGFRLRIVLPTEGRWRLAVVAERRHFTFPALAVGSSEVPHDYVAFPKGSEAARQGAGGVWTQGPSPDAEAPDGVLPPEVISFAEPPRDGGGGGMPLWIPALGLALAGAGAFGIRARR